MKFYKKIGDKHCKWIGTIKWCVQLHLGSNTGGSQSEMEKFGLDDLAADSNLVILRKGAL